LDLDDLARAFREELRDLGVDDPDRIANALIGAILITQLFSNEDNDSKAGRRRKRSSRLVSRRRAVH